MIKITYFNGAPGAGKSILTKKHVVTVPGRHLFVVPRVAGVEEVTIDLGKMRTEHSVIVSLHPFFSDQHPTKATDCVELKSARREGGSVRKRIMDRAADYSPGSHCCFIITHSSFMGIDPAVFRGWHLHIDEIPHNSVISGSIHNPVMWPAYEGLYVLEPIEGSLYSRLRLNPMSNATHLDVMNERAFSNEDINLYARVCSPTPVFIAAQSIEDFGARHCRWYSAWSLAETECFESVEVAASDLTESLMYNLDPVPIIDFPIRAEPSFASVRISYFDAGDQRCSAAYFESEQGRSNLRLIAEHLTEQGGVDFWSCNGSSVDFLKPLVPNRRGPHRPGCEPVGYVPPLIEGTNSLRRLTSCAFLYSSKAQAHESIYAEVAATANIAALVSKANIAAKRELSALLQFVTRSRMRDRSYAGDITIFLYDRQQAEELSAKLRSISYLDVSIFHAALEGFVNRSRVRSGPKVQAMTPEERTNRDRLHARDRKRAQRAREKRQD